MPGRQEQLSVHRTIILLFLHHRCLNDFVSLRIEFFKKTPFDKSCFYQYVSALKRLSYGQVKVINKRYNMMMPSFSS